ncbi:TPA: alanine--glyoxylate aminotransferase family protein [Staphylococcus pseudintermedius]|nr:alanine--glyoxylate aminotransferase family protein [Staphylococcus pseudintermedius]EJD8521215.1 alanine--glyoxylate aminotransferase family protein [Staphylococcus pseudintermedius]HAR6574028.1 alanine--glyoxylate aminotransferase family protein [Staphylococcus pseudintermedius]
MIDFTPGPIQLTIDEIEEISKNTHYFPRDISFSRVYKELIDNLTEIFCDATEKNVLVIPGSGTQTNESIIFSFFLNKKILVLSNGEFGLRLYKQTKNYNKSAKNLNFGMGKEFDYLEIENCLKKNEIEVVMMVHHETSTSIINDLEKINIMKCKYNFELFVDCISSVGCEDLNYKIPTVFSFTSGKAIGGLPGLGIICKNKDLEYIDNIDNIQSVLNLKNYELKFNESNQFPNTPPIFEIACLNYKIKRLNQEGLENKIQKIKSYTEYLRKSLKDSDFSFFEYSHSYSSTYMIVKNAKEVISYLKMNEIYVYEGKNDWQSKYIQLSTIGIRDYDDIDFFINIMRSYTDEKRN